MTVFEKIKCMNHADLAKFLKDISKEYIVPEYFCEYICNGQKENLCSIDNSRCIEDFDDSIAFKYFLDSDYEHFRSLMEYGKKYSEINQNE